MSLRPAETDDPLSRGDGPTDAAAAAAAAAGSSSSSAPSTTPSSRTDAADVIVEQLNAEANQILEDMTLRKRRPWNPDGSLSVSGDIDLLGDDDGLDDEEEEDGVGCPLPSTPEDNQLLEAEVSDLYGRPHVHGGVSATGTSDYLAICTTRCACSSTVEHGRALSCTAITAQN